MNATLIPLTDKQRALLLDILTVWQFMTRCEYPCEVNNIGIALRDADGEYQTFLNTFSESGSSDWLERAAEWARSTGGVL